MNLDDQLVKYLTDAHSIEEQALQQLRMAPGIAGDATLGALYADHLTETEQHERLIRERLEALGGSPSRVKDVVMRAGGIGFVLFARSQPDTPGKLAAHSFSYEALEQASYELLLRVAAVAGDDATAAVAARIRDEERAMAERIEASFGRAVEASLAAKGAEDLSADVDKYLADAHAIEAQAVQLLERAPKIGGPDDLTRIYAEHLEETRAQQRLVDQRLEARGASPSRLKDAMLRLGALNWGGFFQAHPDTPGKLAAFAFAFEHLEIGGYRELRLVAERAGDTTTAAMAERIESQERAAAGRVAAAFDRAAEASLEAQGMLR